MLVSSFSSDIERCLSRKLEIPLLRRLLVARIDERVHDDRQEQDDALDEALDRVINVEDGHAVEQDADEQRAQDDVANPAVTAIEADAAQDDDEEDVVDHRRVE